MERNLKTDTLRVDGMTCVNCRNKIEKKLLNAVGVQKADISYTAGTAVITYDTSRTSLQNITAMLNKLGYEARPENKWRKPALRRTAGLLIIIIALYGFLAHFGVLNFLVPDRLAEPGIEFGMLFLIGLATSMHCVAMCGGINLSQCIPRTEKTGDEGRLSPLRPAALYNLGRILSYTAVGFLVGALGSVFVFSTTAQGVLKFFAGVFMIVMGFNMLGLFPWLRKLTPRMPKFFTRKTEKEKPNRGPLIVGLLNGLMPCGPLQAMQLYALSTGNPFAGALSMLLFALGTVPLMFGFGTLSSILGGKFSKKVLTAGGVLVAVMGLAMFSQGMSLSGLPAGGADIVDTVPESAETVIDSGPQLINSTLLPRKYPDITVQAGIPVKWVIDAPKGSINGCNNRILINEYGIEHSFTVGENVITFTPTKTGTFRYSCWMGMIHGTIRVTDSPNT